ncbi:hypothetical protein D9757_007801 [Collybiopsis confluens]|uniref:Uncharacterized protein n=1 Tax=Collybiopsis confluens TaxID=2823264 RepID=A0A8H5HQ58_9AGAR|nr:hypothetical protein D9757_007801 [Collybiopsis confluens]
MLSTSAALENPSTSSVNSLTPEERQLKRVGFIQAKNCLYQLLSDIGAPFEVLTGSPLLHGHYEAAHMVPSSADDSTLLLLEYAFGFNSRTFAVHSKWNLAPSGSVSIDFGDSLKRPPSVNQVCHRVIDKHGAFLLPSMESIEYMYKHLSSIATFRLEARGQDFATRHPDLTWQRIRHCGHKDTYLHTYSFILTDAPLRFLFYIHNEEGQKVLQMCKEGNGCNFQYNMPGKGSQDSHDQIFHTSSVRSTDKKWQAFRNSETGKFQCPICEDASHDRVSYFVMRHILNHHPLEPHPTEAKYQDPEPLPGPAPGEKLGLMPKGVAGVEDADRAEEDGEQVADGKDEQGADADDERDDEDPTNDGQVADGKDEQGADADDERDDEDPTNDGPADEDGDDGNDKPETEAQTLKQIDVDDGWYHNRVPTLLTKRFVGHPPAPYHTVPSGHPLWTSDSGKIYTYGHPTGTFSCSHSAPGTPDPHCDPSCAVLAYLNAAYVPILKGFARIDLKRMIGRTELEEVIAVVLQQESWSPKPGRIDTVFKQLCAHIEEAFGDSLQSFEDIAEHAKTVVPLEPIPFLIPPQQTAPCPGCGLYFQLKLGFQSYTRHMKKCYSLHDLPHSELKARARSCIEGNERWSQPLHQVPWNQKHRVVLSELYCLHLNAQDPTNPNAAPLPSFPLIRPFHFPERWWQLLIDIQYGPALSPEQILDSPQSLDPGEVLRFVERPLVAACRYKMDTDEWRVEQSLLLAQAAFTVYLKEAGALIQKVPTFSDILKDYSGLNFRSGFKSSSSYSRYAKIATAALAFSLRRIQSPDMSSLLPLSHPNKDLEKVIQEIHRDFKAFSPDRTALSLIPVLHRFVVGITVTSEPLIAHHLSLVEYTLLFLNLNGDGTVCDAGGFTALLAKSCRVITSSTLLATVNGGWSEVLTLPLQLKNNGPHTSTSTLSPGDRSDVDEGSGSSSSSSEDSEDDSDDGGEDNPASKYVGDGSDSDGEGDGDSDEEECNKWAGLGLQIKHAIKQVLSKKDQSHQTTFSVLHKLWNEADLYSRSVKDKTQFIPDATNTGFTFQPTYGPTRRVRLTDFARNTQIELEALESCFQKLVPASLLPSLRRFEIKRLNDDPSSPQSLFKREDNSAYLAQFIGPLFHQLQAKKPSNGDITLGLNREKTSVWIRDSEEMQRHLVQGILPVTGICPRNFQATNLTYDTFGQQLRSLKLFEDHIILCNPLAGRKTTRQFECFWTLPHSLTWYLLLHLGVIRPVLKMLLMSPAVRDSSAIPSLNRYIFVSMAARSRNFKWSGPEIDLCLMNTVFGVKAADLRLMNTNIIYRWFPHLGCANEHLHDRSSSSALSRQGQHSARVCKSNYGQSGYLKATSFDVVEFRSQVQISHAFAQLDHIGRFGGECPTEHLTLSMVDCIAHNGHRAMVRAEQFLLAEKPGYNIKMDSRDNIRSSCRFLLRAKPYLRGEEAQEAQGNWTSSWDTLGDEGLVQVTAALTHGFALEEPENNSLQIGYSPRFVASAIYLFDFAINQWATGSYVSLNWENNPRRDEQIASIEKSVLFFKKHRREGWIEFRKKIDFFNPNIDERATETNPPSFNAFYSSSLVDDVEPDSEEEEESRFTLKVADNLEELRAREEAQARKEAEIDAEMAFLAAAAAEDAQAHEIARENAKKGTIQKQSRSNEDDVGRKKQKHAKDREKAQSGDGKKRKGDNRPVNAKS